MVRQATFVPAARYGNRGDPSVGKRRLRRRYSRVNLGSFAGLPIHSAWAV